MDYKRDFISGVVEGFYGRPWVLSQRKELFRRLQRMGLNTYLYAPKDDLKHRQMWRELYSDYEVMQLKMLIDTSKSKNVVFVYAISPGLDITFSSANDIYLLKEKLNQVANLGCKAFAILFDDIDPNLNNTDHLMFNSFAFAQATITNDIYNFLNKPSCFMCCPTEYCATRAVPNVKNSEYLKTLGNTLLPEIHIMWTGPKVISKYITLESIVTLKKAIGRAPIIWDNIHANDYDQKRLFLGPYCGRSSKLIPHIRGVLINPNCEFEGNFVPMHTLAQWAKLNKPECCNLPGGDDCNDKYVPTKALDLALHDWLILMYKSENWDNKDQLIDHHSSFTKVVAPVISGNDFLRNSLPNHQHKTSTTVPTSPEIISRLSIPFNGTDPFTNRNKPQIPVSHSPILSVPARKSSDSIIINLSQTKTTIVNELPYNFKPFYVSSANNRNIVPSSSEMDLVTKTEEHLELSDHTNEMVLDQSTNTLGLTPMEIEDNQMDLDSMAMQVDSFYENMCENMDIIDDMDNNSNLDKRKESKDIASVKDTKSDMDCVGSNKSSEASENISCADPSKLTVTELHLLVHMFFLPYEHGPWAIKMLKLVRWLRFNSFVINRHNRHFTGNGSHSSDDQLKEHVVDADGSLESKLKIFEWQKRAKEFTMEFEKARNMIDRFTRIPNRSILYDIYPYLEDMRHVLSTLASYVKWLGRSPGYKESLMNEDHEPWVFRGGLISEFQRMFPLEGSNDLFPNKISFFENSCECLHSSSDSDSDNRQIKIKENLSRYFNTGQQPDTDPIVYMIQPYRSTYRNQLYSLCFDILYNQLTRDDIVNKTDLAILKSERFRNLPGDRYLGAYLEFCPSTCMVLEDNDDQICGYGLGTNRVKDFLKYRREIYNSKMRKKYSFFLLNKDAESNLDTENSLITGTSKISIVEVLIKGFSECDWDKYFQNDLNSSALIYVDLFQTNKYLEYSSIETVGCKLMKSLCSLLKNPSVQAENMNYVPNPSYDRRCSSLHESTLEPDSEFLYTSFKSSVTVPDLENSSSNSSLGIFCEVDWVHKRNEDFYRRNGFDICDNDGITDDVFLMSRDI